MTGGERDGAVRREGVVGDELLGGRHRDCKEVRLVFREEEDDLVGGEVDLRPGDVAEDAAEGDGRLAEGVAADGGRSREENGKVVGLADVAALVIRRVRHRRDELNQADLPGELRGVEGGLHGELKRGEVKEARLRGGDAEHAERRDDIDVLLDDALGS